jgi:hypothetical protein
MKYRIKIITFKNGRKEYYPQFKVFGLWAGIWYNGKAQWICDDECQTREEALLRIDKHFAGNTKRQTIEFEYVFR